MAYLLCLFIPIADIFSSILYKLGYADYLYYIRHIYFYSIFIVGLGFFNIKNSGVKIYKILILYYIIIFLYSLSSLIIEVNYKTIIFSAGSLILPMALFTFGFSKFNKINSVDFIFGGLISVCILSTIFSLWEIQNTDFWIKTIEFPNYLKDVKGVVLGIEPSTGLPWNFFKDVDPEDGRRSAGLIAAPLAQGIILSFGFVGSASYFIAFKKPIHFFIAILIGYGLYINGTRGAILVAMIALTGIIYADNFFIRNKILKIAILILSTLLLYLLFGQKFHETINFLDGSTIGHLDALLLNLKDISKIFLIGVGVGLHGANATNDQIQDIGGGEGAIFSIAYQIGLPGALVFIYLYFLIIKEIYLIRFSDLPKRIICLSYVFFWIGIGLLITFITSEHILTLSGMSFFWILCGALYSINRLRNNVNGI